MFLVLESVNTGSTSVRRTIGNRQTWCKLRRLQTIFELTDCFWKLKLNIWMYNNIQGNESWYLHSLNFHSRCFVNYLNSFVKGRTWICFDQFFFAWIVNGWLVIRRNIPPKLKEYPLTLADAVETCSFSYLITRNEYALEIITFYRINFEHNRTVQMNCWKNLASGWTNTRNIWCEIV